VQGVAALVHRACAFRAALPGAARAASYFHRPSRPLQVVAGAGEAWRTRADEQLSSADLAVDSRQPLPVSFVTQCDFQELYDGAQILSSRCGANCRKSAGLNVRIRSAPDLAAPLARATDAQREIIARFAEGLAHYRGQRFRRGLRALGWAGGKVRTRAQPVIDHGRPRPPLHGIAAARIMGWRFRAYEQVTNRQIVMKASIFARTSRAISSGTAAPAQRTGRARISILRM